MIDEARRHVFSEDVRALSESGSQRSYRKGTLLIAEGDAGDTLYVILSGTLRAFSADANGREITYGIYGPGEYLGEMSLDGGLRSASVEAVEATVCAVVTRETLRRYIGAHPDFAFELLAKVIRRARMATLSAKHLALNDVYGRMRLLFGSLGTVRPDGMRAITERFTHADLASRVGCSREMVSRVMKDLEKGGYLQREGKQIIVRATLPARW